MGQSLARPDLPGAGSRYARHERPQPRRSSRRSLSDFKTDGARLLIRSKQRSSTTENNESRLRIPRASRAHIEPNANSRETGTSSRYRKQREELEVHRRKVTRRENMPSRPHRAREPESTKESRKTHSRGSHSYDPRRRLERASLKSNTKAGVTGVEVVELKELGRKRDCIVCVETLPLRRFSDRTPTLRCTHESNVCRRCLRNWIKTQFGMKVWDQINCPECKERMQYDDMREFASMGVFRRYDRLSTRAALEAIPGFRWCMAKGCKSGQVHEGHLTPRFRCVACKASHCTVHQRPWHKGETCAEYDYRTDGSLKKAEEDASKALIRETAKKCPGCKWNIEKNNGCDHMTCSKCKHEFCWTCLASYEPIRRQGNHMHRSNCQYFTEAT